MYSIGLQSFELTVWRAPKYDCRVPSAGAADVAAHGGAPLGQVGRHPLCGLLVVHRQATHLQHKQRPQSLPQVAADRWGKLATEGQQESSHCET